MLQAAEPFQASVAELRALKAVPALHPEAEGADEELHPVDPRRQGDLSIRKTRHHLRTSKQLKDRRTTHHLTIPLTQMHRPFQARGHLECRLLGLDSQVRTANTLPPTALRLRRRMGPQDEATLPEYRARARREAVEA